MKVILKRKITNRIVSGHPSVYANEVEKIEEGIDPGNIVELFCHDKKFIGRGYFNPRSQILVRLLTRDRNEEINAEFFRKKILACWNYRRKIGYEENCRLVFGEADGLP